MSKKWLVALVVGIILSLASFGIKTSNNTQLFCTTGNGPLDELAASSRTQRGYPLPYYLEKVPEKCSVNDIGFDAALDAPVNAEFKLLVFIFNTLVWVVLAIIGTLIYAKKRKI